MPEVPGAVLSAAYKAQQQSLFWSSIVLQRTARALMGQSTKVDKEQAAPLNRRFQALLERDLKNVADGLYPASLLRFPVERHLRHLPQLLMDIPKTVRRLAARDHNDLPSHADSERYPNYYRRNFHWQTDGYFSKHSAEIYDVGVEFLFAGTADVMRRQVIPPITRHIRAHNLGEGKLLDIACGTGRTLEQFLITHPRLRCFGLDLSPYYIEQARELLAGAGDLSLVAENAEEMPFVDDYFDFAVSVYLFHELPKDARRQVMSEAYRVLEPGGLFVIEDSIQLADSPKLMQHMYGFVKQFHEPYYKGYLQDDLATALRETGFDVVAEESHFVAKVVVAQKPG